MISLKLKQLLLFISLIFLPAMTTSSALQQIEPSDISSAFILNKKAKVLRLNFFVHGTYASETSLLNILKLYADESITNSRQEKLVRSFMRQRCKNLYDSSLMYDEGLWLVNHNIGKTSAQSSLALWPILTSFNLSSQEAVSTNIQQVNFLFGWHGLLSSDGRQKAAISLYNAINHQYQLAQKTLQLAGKLRTKIEVHLYSHSHGGNLSLFLGLIDSVCRQQNTKILQLYNKFDLKLDKVQKDLAAMTELFGSLPTQQTLAHQMPAPLYNLEKWLFKPTAWQKPTMIKHLTLLATPIIEETWPLSFSDSFERVTSIYSDGDAVQAADFVSTQQHRSWRIVKPSLVRLGNIELALPNSHLPRFRQIKVRFPDAQSTLPNNQSVIDKIKTNIKAYVDAGKQRDLKALVAEKLRQAIIAPETLDGPTHGEFWLLSWRGNSERLTIRPMPLVCFVPQILKLADEFDQEYLELTLGVDDQKTPWFSIVPATSLLKRKGQSVAELPHLKSLLACQTQASKPVNYVITSSLLRAMHDDFQAHRTALTKYPLTPPEDALADKINRLTSIALRLASS